LIFSKQKPGKEGAPTNAHLDMVRTRHGKGNLDCVSCGERGGNTGLHSLIRKRILRFFTEPINPATQVKPWYIKGNGESSPRLRVDFSVSLPDAP